MFDLIIKNGKVVTPEGITHDVIAIKDGKIVALLDKDYDARTLKTIDAEGKYVFPGFIDTHAHLNDPGYQWREDYIHGTEAAAIGGYTTIVDMPIQNEPAVINAISMDEKIKVASQKSYVDFGLWGGLIPTNLDELKGQHDMGCLCFKSFLSPVGPDYSSMNYGQAYEAMEIIKEFDGRAGFHCEDYSMIKWQEERLKRQGKTDWQAFLDSRPVAAEIIATTAIIELAKATGCKAHICHVSSPKVAKIIKEAQKEGYDITAETCPHYLSMTEKDLLENGALFKCAPPLRTKEEMEELWDYVVDGTFSGIVSDHSPCSYEEKFVKIGNKEIKTAFDPWGGMSSIQTSVQTAFYEGCIKRNICPSVLANVMSKKAAMAFGIYGQKGDIKVGFDADLVIIDPEKEWEIKAEDLRYLNKISSSVGKKGKGTIDMTIIRGKVVAKDGNIQAYPGYGQHVKHR